MKLDGGLRVVLSVLCMSAQTASVTQVSAGLEVCVSKVYLIGLYGTYWHVLGCLYRLPRVRSAFLWGPWFEALGGTSISCFNQGFY